jgi:hypothetical protein
MKDFRWSPTLPVLAVILGVAAGASLAVRAQVSPTPRDVRPQPVQQPPRDPREGTPPVAVGNGSITGIVVVSGSRQPARRARVNLGASQEAGGSRTAVTDDRGRFAFNALPAGRFNLSASKPGHLNATYGQRQPGRPGTPIQLADGQRLEVQLQLTRGGVITGTVLDEYGEAIPNTPVRALRYVIQGGQRTLQSAGNAQTDDRGAYRIFGLQPGDHIVYATPRNVGTEGVERPRQAELQALLQRAETLNRAEPGLTQVLIERAAQLKAELSAASADETTGYAPVYYPGTTTPSSAVAIPVGPGEEKSGVDFQYQVVPIARIEGIVTSPIQASNIQITLVNTGFNVPGLGPGGTRADQQGAFRLSNVPPGQYTLIARATINQGGREGGPAGRGVPPGGRGELLDGRGRGAAMPAADQIRLWATADVTVDGRSVSNVTLALQPGMSVAGRVTFEGTTQQLPADLTRMRVTLAPVVMPGTPGELASAAPGRVDAEGRFTISSVVPGRYRLSASGAGSGWFLGSSIVEGQDSLDYPLEVKANQNISNAAITFVDRQTELSGTITNTRAEPVTDFSLIVYPADSRYWSPQSRRIQFARPATDGRFAFRNLPAGEYRLAPVLDPEPGSWFDPAFLEQLDSTAVRVSITEGEKKEQNLRVPGGG